LRDLAVDVVGDDVRDLLALLPEPRVALRQRLAIGFLIGGVIEIAFDLHVLVDFPPPAVLDKRDVEIRENVEAERVGGTDRAGILRASPFPAALDVDVLAGTGSKRSGGT
jgi:hypothetical protein